MPYSLYRLFIICIMPESRLNGFDAVAGVYDSLARLVYGKSIRAAQIQLLHVIPPDAKVLMIGGGTGWLLRELLVRNTSCSVWYIEASAKMVAAAGRAVANDTRVHFIHGTEEAIPQGIVFDVVITNFFLDLFTLPFLKQVVARLRKSLRTGGYWLAADFVDTGKLWQRWLLRIMFMFFRITAGLETRELANWGEVLLMYRVKETDVRYFYGGFIRSVVYESV
jgi:ubiquinone/menaquinone biosynthesis C-methylase UbiE